MSFLLLTRIIMDAVMNCDFCEQISESALLHWVQAVKKMRVVRICNGR